MMNLISGKKIGRIHIGRVGTYIIGANNIRIDRGHSILSNKFKLKDEMWRDECCDWYDDWLREQFFACSGGDSASVSAEIIRIVGIIESGKDVNLQCWCAPKRCHGQSIKKLVLQYIKERK